MRGRSPEPSRLEINSDACDGARCKKRMRSVAEQSAAEEANASTHRKRRRRDMGPPKSDVSCRLDWWSRRLPFMDAALHLELRRFPVEQAPGLFGLRGA